MTQLIKTQSLLIISTWALLIFIFRFNFANSISIYEELKSYGLPMGLLPKGVTNYTLDDESGMFEVYLDQPCNVKFESELHYETNVTGRLSDGQIGNLTGISAQDLFLWFLVKGIRVDMPSSGLVHFDVGVVDKQFSLSWFEIPLDCVAAERPQVDFDDGRLVNNILLAEDADKEPADGARGVIAFCIGSKFREVACTAPVKLSW
ncbi:hypothetical protein AKJ16_DCAP06988 [Drosera capensis]